MRSLLFTVPAGLALACAGGLLLLESQQPQVRTFPIRKGDMRHPVTEAMTRETEAKAARNAPGFATSDYAGEPVTLAPPVGTRPQFIYFVQDGCPCSFDAEPLFQRLYKRYKGKIDFFTVTDADPKKAQSWSVQMLVPYPVIPDPKKEIIRAYEAKSSVYAALVDPAGKIVRMWPGYSQSILKEQNALMARLAKVKEVPFDAQYAPKERATGCAF